MNLRRISAEFTGKDKESNGDMVLIDGTFTSRMAYDQNKPRELRNAHSACSANFIY